MLVYNKLELGKLTILWGTSLGWEIIVPGGMEATYDMRFPCWLVDWVVYVTEVTSVLFCVREDVVGWSKCWLDPPARCCKILLWIINILLITYIGCD